MGRDVVGCAEISQFRGDEMRISLERGVSDDEEQCQWLIPSTPLLNITHPLDPFIAQRLGLPIKRGFEVLSVGLII